LSETKAYAFYRMPLRQSPTDDGGRFTGEGKILSGRAKSPPKINARVVHLLA
jgi:hypothetical protein